LPIGGIHQAEKYQDELFDWMNRIIANPYIGKAYNFSILPYRKSHINKHLIFKEQITKIT